MTGRPLERMQSIARAWEEAGDRRSVFPAAYAAMTTAMHEAIEADRFIDADWVSALLELFADYYFRAVAGFEQGMPIPDCWRHALEAPADLDVLQHLLLGINAHINRDLVFTTVEMLERHSGRVEDRRVDFDRVNEVIRTTIDTVQDEVVATRSKFWSAVDAMLWPLDEWAFAGLIESWRDDVWASAVRHLQASSGDRPALGRRVEEAAAERAKAIIRLG
jgi:hypothetical protein